IPKGRSVHHAYPSGTGRTRGSGEVRDGARVSALHPGGILDVLGNPGSSKQPNYISAEARAAALALLAGGAWVPRSWFVSKTRHFSHQLPTFGEVLGLAESDLGAFICLPTDSTPEIAPDEALAAGGLSKHNAVIEAVRAWRAERRLGEMIREQKE